MPAPKSLVRTFASLCQEKSLLVFALTVSRLSTILMTERFRVNARTVLMNCLTELAPSKMELAGMFVCLFVCLFVYLLMRDLGYYVGFKIDKNLMFNLQKSSNS